MDQNQATGMLAMTGIQPAREVIRHVDKKYFADVLNNVRAPRAARVLDLLPVDEATDLLKTMDRRYAEVLSHMNPV